MRDWNTRHPVEARTRRALTLIEILVVIGIIIVLITLLIVALAAGSNLAASARTRALMTSMSQGFTQFERDFNKKPSVLDVQRNVLGAPDLSSGSIRDELQQWFSFTSAADYLLGYGGENQDGADGLGIRDPGVDGVWGATSFPNSGLLTERNPITNGKVHGPYLQLTDEKLLAKIDASGNLIYPEDAAYTSSNLPLVVLDYWGRPIRYYRRHPLKLHQTSAQTLDLGDVILLRPFSISPDDDATSVFDDNGGDNGTSMALKSAQFALFSGGPDQTFNDYYRFDDPAAGANTEHNNEDNIVEVGQ